MINHRIHRQRWQIKAASQEAAFAIRQQLRSHLDTELLPVFERTFDALVTDDEVVRIPRLTLDIKLDGNGDFITALAEALPDALRDRLDEILQDASSAQPALAQPGQTGTQRLSASASLRSTLLNYLASGLPAWHDRRAADEDTLLQMLCKEAVSLAGEASELRDAIGGTLAQRINASFRLLQLLPAESRATLLRLAPLALPVSPPGNRTADLTGQTSPLPDLLRRFAISSILPPGSHLLLRAQAMLLALSDEELHRPLAPLIDALLREFQRHVATQTGSGAAEMLSDVETLLKSGDAPTDVMPPEKPDSRAAPPAASPTKLSARPQTDDAPDAGYLADDAGLILLHPFLPRLFDVMNLSSGSILPEERLPRAAALLHWLVNAREEVYEFELTTIKILLGLTPDQSLLVGAGLLSEAERTEADALLAAAISHWNALGKTGVAALRTSFLQRRGLLRDLDSGWQLQLEPEPFDLLLGRLPWSIGLVRLPWMSRPIFVEWPTQ